MDIHAIRSSVAGSLEPIRALRHDLHRHPELSFYESRTSGVVQRELGGMGREHLLGHFDPHRIRHRSVIVQRHC